MGFKEYGINPREFKLKDGTYRDEIIMANIFEWYCQHSGSNDSVYGIWENSWRMKKITYIFKLIYIKYWYYEHNMIGYDAEKSWNMHISND